jgi:hypothetical protein
MFSINILYNNKERERISYSQGLEGIGCRASENSRGQKYSQQHWIVKLAGSYEPCSQVTHMIRNGRQR